MSEQLHPQRLPDSSPYKDGESPIIKIQDLCVTYFPGRSNEVKALKEVHYSGDDKVVFVIEFENVPEWTTAVEVVFPGEREKTFLSERTGKSIEQVVSR